MPDYSAGPARLAVDCRWLRRTLDSSMPDDPFLMLCTHIVRDGRDCIGPFLENLETTCQLWEPNERLAARIAAAGEASRAARAAGADRLTR
ncbi:MAG: hypothetical protein O3A10_12360 [Chloroflexi bacterium]|nr:hypothetical protein [Chloroflexota bacterium]MDA1146238.1 hypothetical protein [Chloroflexota bacterium]